MANAIYLDCHAGIAGDMLLSALVDLGADPHKIESELKTLPLDNFELHFQKKVKQGIHAMTLNIDFDEPHHHRHASDIFKMIDDSALSTRVKARSKSIFEVIGHAEAKIHGMSFENVHFHEVGAMDSIIDIIGGCIALELLNIDELYCSPIPTGNGKINIAHGIYPVPAPATAEILKDVPLAKFDVQSELTTPTGAAFAKSLVSSFGPFPSATMKEIGYGAGSKDFDFPNVLRVIQFETQSKKQDDVQVIECQIDDMSPESLGHFMDISLEHGALDIYYTPIFMKKGRPSTQLTLICKTENASKFETLILQETSSLGVRSYAVRRNILDREFRDIDTDYGNISVKFALQEGKILKMKPEYEDVKQAAKRFERPFHVIHNEIIEALYHTYQIGEELK
ncbi:pyridinium-3,5-bisthiocarboxylic acid mononucleotide nickel chelatase [Staphylococcus capitis]|uniref:nickel pincer cofactor biosynthesis protein LarC n=1 Tax=Staphylococcus capitis TaxID=29388 RepID=UPI00066D86D8|nr:nickel pincer cofactor biosynthesis protein LarC [Staphylococcus capitis]MBC3050100.1 nickel pincer cofactor biosynthesis protein LarC [Staphylococcus capitis]MBC3070144.1 nickel pincer cofactor biosynthesis protein LarC [Staphylococcus capitis]MCM3283961.1 nickel pincer cofactor biosynthesis protein LarC [Staphylococcus capitis]MDS4034377.1 nickel pincer cofactor biosynthesis protein LarC [Staphylococcus capitis]OAN23275.1 TIGR00299 family protein [Staphylococcus capitis]